MLWEIIFNAFWLFLYCSFHLPPIVISNEMEESTVQNLLSFSHPKRNLIAASGEAHMVLGQEKDTSRP